MRGQRETRPCAACGKPITRLLSQARGAQWFCNHACQIRAQPTSRSVSREPNPLRGQKATRPCVQCAQPVTRYLSQRRLDQEWTCSRTCKATYQTRKRMEAGTWKRPVNTKKGRMVPCHVCGVEFWCAPNEVRDGRKYCSRPCQNIGMAKPSIVKSCAWCGKEMRLKPSQAERQYCSKRCDGLSRIKLALTGREHNGKPVRKNRQGYVLIWEPSQGWNGWVLEHRWLMAQHLGRRLSRDEHVDHINRIRDDNRLENLQVLSANDHGMKSGTERASDYEQMRVQLAAYRERYGLLE